MSLKKSQVNFKWTEEVELYVVKQYAEYIAPTQTALNIVEEFEQYCFKDIEKHSEEEFLSYLLKRIYLLNPRNVRFPNKYSDAFVELRRSYLYDFDKSYLSQTRNRVRELEGIFDVLRRDFHSSDSDPALRRSIGLAMKDISKEIKDEMKHIQEIRQGTIEESNERAVEVAHDKAITSGTESDDLSTEVDSAEGEIEAEETEI